MEQIKSIEAARARDQNMRDEVYLIVRIELITLKTIRHKGHQDNRAHHSSHHNQAKIDSRHNNIK